MFDPKLAVGHDERFQAFLRIAKVFYHRPKSIVEELRVYRNNMPALIDYVMEITEFNEKTSKELDRVYEKTDERANKRWTPEDDELLIEQVCDEGVTPVRLSTIFGRTPSAISSRITYLVGVKRLSQSVAGRFIGKMDGHEVDADIEGTVHFEKKEG